MRRTLTGLVALAVTVLGPVPVEPGDVPGVTDREVVLGVTTALSGPAAAWGNSGVGMAAWAEYVNDQGGIHGRRLRVILKDDGHHPGRAIANLKELGDSAFAVVGLLGSATLRASRAYITEQRIPLVNPYGSPSIWADLPPDKLRYVFVNRPDYIDEAGYLATYAGEQLRARRVAVFYQNDDMGLEALAGLQAGIKRLGGKVELVATIPYEVADRTMGIHALRLRDSRADAVILYATPAHAANLIKEMAKLAYRPHLLASHLLGDHTTMFRLLGSLWEDAIYTVIWAVRGEPEAERAIEILLRYEPRLEGKEVFGLSGAIPMMILVEGLKRAGRELTRESFITAMETIQGFSPGHLTAPITFGANRRHGSNAFRLMRAVSAKANRVTALTGYLDFPPRY